MERRPLPLIAAAMDVLTSCFAQASRPSSGTNYQPTQFTKGSIPAATGGITLSAGPRVVVPGILSRLCDAQVHSFQLSSTYYCVA